MKLNTTWILHKVLLFCSLRPLSLSPVPFDTDVTKVFKSLVTFVDLTILILNITIIKEIISDDSDLYNVKYHFHCLIPSILSQLLPSHRHKFRITKFTDGHSDTRSINCGEVESKKFRLFYTYNYGLGVSTLLIYSIVLLISYRSWIILTTMMVTTTTITKRTLILMIIPSDYVSSLFYNRFDPQFLYTSISLRFKFHGSLNNYQVNFVLSFVTILVNRNIQKDHTHYTFLS